MGAGGGGGGGGTPDTDVAAVAADDVVPVDGADLGADEDVVV